MLNIDLFKEKLDSWVARASGAYDREWTSEVKKILFDLAPDLPGVNVCASGGGARWGEWLCDVTWLQYSGNGFGDPLEKMLLAAESEWGNWDSILEDFEKLLVCRADVRVMIFDDSKGVDANNTVRDLKRHASMYKDIEVGDYFVFAYYEREKDKFSVEEWSYSA